jgi:hypothetical protein
MMMTSGEKVHYNGMLFVLVFLSSFLPVVDLSFSSTATLVARSSRLRVSLPSSRVPVPTSSYVVSPLSLFHLTFH